MKKKNVSSFLDNSSHLWLCLGVVCRLCEEGKNGKEESFYRYRLKTTVCDDRMFRIDFEAALKEKLIQVFIKDNLWINFNKIWMLQCSLRFRTNKKFKFQVIKTNEYPNVERHANGLENSFYYHCTEIMIMFWNHYLMTLCKMLESIIKNMKKAKH